MPKPYWDNGIVQLHHGDCRDVLAQMPAESVHCVVTSPPYLALARRRIEAVSLPMKLEA